jgi:hypothetical protein
MNRSFQRMLNVGFSKYLKGGMDMKKISCSIPEKIRNAATDFKCNY